jgi:37-kD nucleoid-associated bacterial protein
MPIAFEIQSIALHLVDKKDKSREEPRYSNSVIDLGSASYSKQQKAAIQSFLAGHLQRAWDTAEGGRTRAARFEENSPVREFSSKLPEAPQEFFEMSKSLAKRLYDISPVNASRGLLLVLRFTVPDASQPFLGLFKLDPGDRDQIALERDEQGQILLKLAVAHIQEALPEPGDRVLKWALIPHPPVADDSSQFDLKLRDEQQAKIDPAAYFEGFLGCVSQPSTNQEIREVGRVVREYAEERHPRQDWRPKLDTIVRSLGEGKEVVTPAVVASKIEQAAVFTGFDRKVFQKRLAASGARDMRIGPERFRSARIRYELPSGIVIHGPADKMEEKVTVVATADGYLIQVSTSDYTKKVEP